jgi:hypothetical protein
MRQISNSSVLNYQSVIVYPCKDGASIKLDKNLDIRFFLYQFPDEFFGQLTHLVDLLVQ